MPSFVLASVHFEFARPLRSPAPLAACYPTWLPTCADSSGANTLLLRPRDARPAYPPLDAVYSSQPMVSAMGTLSKPQPAPRMVRDKHHLQDRGLYRQLMAKAVCTAHLIIYPTMPVDCPFNHVPS